jgi:hypothetical protein
MNIRLSPRKRLFTVTTILIGVLVGTTGVIWQQSTAAKANQPKKYLIEVGWDAPTPNIVRARIADMEKSPFAGAMINLNAGKTFLNKKAYAESAFLQDREDLAAVNSKTFNQSFITMWSAREAGWDWFSDSDWAAAQTNADNFTRVAAASRSVKGLMFDPEPYGTNPWTYTAELYPSRSFISVQDKVRERGASFMKTVQDAKPDIKILMLFGLTIVHEQAQTRGSLEKADWALYASFIDGMLSVMGPKVELIDGNEQSYYLTSAADFDTYRPLKNAARELLSAENRARYDKQMSVGNAVFVDGLLNIYNSPRFFGLYLQKPQQRLQFMEHNAFHALRTTDKYAWVYNEHMDWWGTFGKGVKTPVGVDARMRRAVSANRKGTPLGFDVESFAAAARKRYAGKVELDGRVSSKGVGVGGVALQTEFMFEGRDTACESTKPDGYYQCWVPPNWSGRITPSKEGYTFDKPFFQANNATEANFNVNFEATPTG